MGYALAERGGALRHRVLLVSGPTALDDPPGVEVRRVVSAAEMAATVDEAVDRERFDLILAVAAVADYRPADRRAGKLPRTPDGMVVEMVANPDLLGGLGRRRAAGTLDAVLVGFALEAGTPQEILARGRTKLAAKQIDLIVVNHLSAMGAPDNAVTLVFADGREETLPRQDKYVLAEPILAAALQLVAGRGAAADETGGRNR